MKDSETNRQRVPVLLTSHGDRSETAEKAYRPTCMCHSSIHTRTYIDHHTHVWFRSIIGYVTYHTFVNRTTGGLLLVIIYRLWASERFKSVQSRGLRVKRQTDLPSRTSVGRLFSDFDDACHGPSVTLLTQAAGRVTLPVESTNGLSILR